MSALENNPRIRLFSRSPLSREIDAFLIDRQARGLSPRTVEFYRQKLKALQSAMQAEGITEVEQITPRILRAFFVTLTEGHNPGGVHAVYRSVRAFLRWWEIENDIERSANPVHKLQPPKVPKKILAPVPLDDVRAMLRTCERRDFTGDRDRAILLCLLDSGCRRAEFCSLTVADVNLRDGTVLVRQGKGSKPRTVFLGAKSRRALVAYLRHRADAHDSAPLWVGVHGDRLTYAGLREIVRRRARKAGVSEPSLHSFRRAFALLSLRSGMDVYSLQRLMGHSDLSVLRQYLAQTEEDLRQAHERSGPVDNLL